MDKDGVIILGCYYPKADLEAIGKARGSHDLWSMNDYYASYRGLQVDMIFNPHPLEVFNGIRDRLPGRWKAWRKEYNKSCQPVMVCHDLEVDCQIFMPYERLKELFGEKVFVSTGQYMLAMAYYLGYANIRLHGFDMRSPEPSEYGEQIPAMLNLIDQIREMDKKIKITCSMEIEQAWRIHCDSNKINYHELPEIKEPYHLRGVPWETT